MYTRRMCKTSDPVIDFITPMKPLIEKVLKRKQDSQQRLAKKIKRAILSEESFEDVEFDTWESLYRNSIIGGTGTAIAEYVNKHMSTDVYTDDMYLKEAYDILCAMKNVNAKKQTFELFKKYIGCILLIERGSFSQ